MKIADILFPRTQPEKKAEEVISNIVKLNLQLGDDRSKYPCPAYSFFPYRDDKVREMIWRLKYRGDRSVAELFAKSMYDQLIEEMQELALWAGFTVPILVPIPISRKKKRLRGFNQSAALCMALSALDNMRSFSYSTNVLYKIKDTKSQARVKDRTSRLQNLKDSFSVKDNALVNGRNIILLDDVLTTGATLTEATRVLKNAGAKNVIWVVVAH